MRFVGKVGSLKWVEKAGEAHRAWVYLLPNLMIGR